MTQARQYKRKPVFSIKNTAIPHGKPNMRQRNGDCDNRREKRKAPTADQSQTASDLSVITVVISMPSTHTDSGIQNVPMNCPEYPDCFSL